MLLHCDTSCSLSSCTKTFATLLQNKFAFNSVPPHHHHLLFLPSYLCYFLVGQRESPREQMMSFIIKPGNYTTPHPSPQNQAEARRSLYLFRYDKTDRGGIVMRCHVTRRGGKVAFGKRRGRRMGDAGPLCVLPRIFSD